MLLKPTLNLRIQRISALAAIAVWLVVVFYADVSPRQAKKVSDVVARLILVDLQ